MVVDCGGGTVDITVHQLEDLNKETLKELHKVRIEIDQETSYTNVYKNCT